MSIIYFLHPARNVEIRGSERTHFYLHCKQLFLESLCIEYAWEGHVLQRYAPAWVNNDRTARTYFGGISCEEIAGYSTFALSLNTAISLGADFVKLAAYTHGMCEAHGYFEPEDFEWLAKVIERGRTSGFYRAKQGWEELLDLLMDQKSGPEPIVMSYSVRDNFPNPRLIAEDPDNEEETEGLHGLPSGELWDRCVAKLRKSNQRISRDLSAVGHGLGGYQLIEELTSGVLKGL